MYPAKLSLRFGLAFVLLYAGISSLISPNDWIWYIPSWITNIIPGEPLLMIHAISEILLALWLLTGRFTLFAAIAMALDMLSITLVNINILGVVFRDIGLLFSAIALAFLYKDTPNMTSSKK